MCRQTRSVFTCGHDVTNVTKCEAKTNSQDRGCWAMLFSSSKPCKISNRETWETYHCPKCITREDQWWSSAQMNDQLEWARAGRPLGGAHGRDARRDHGDPRVGDRAQAPARDMLPSQRSRSRSVPMSRDAIHRPRHGRSHSGENGLDRSRAARHNTADPRVRDNSRTSSSADSRREVRNREVRASPPFTIVRKPVQSHDRSRERVIAGPSSRTNNRAPSSPPRTSDRPGVRLERPPLGADATPTRSVTSHGPRVAHQTRPVSPLNQSDLDCDQVSIPSHDEYTEYDT